VKKNTALDALKNMAHVVDGVVVNVSLWDGKSDWESSQEVVEIPADSFAGIGWDYVDGEFVDNRPAEENNFPSEQQLVGANTSEEPVPGTDA
jgi:hypothetical protein